MLNLISYIILNAVGLLKTIRLNYSHHAGNRIQSSKQVLREDIDGRVFKKFRDTCPEIVPKRMIGNEPMTVKVPLENMEKLPELKENPFRRRICEVFSRDGKGHLTFEDLLDLLSAFSEQAPRDIKVFYAFKIYDFDGDRYIGIADLEQAARLLTRNELSAEEISQIAEKVIEEADVDGDGKLSYMEFEHVILRAPDFLTTFHIRI